MSASTFATPLRFSSNSICEGPSERIISDNGSTAVTLLHSSRSDPSTRPRRPRSSLPRAHVREPIAIDARRDRTPRVRHFGRQEGRGERLEQLLAPIRPSALSQGGQCGDGVVVEVTPWQGRVGLSLPLEKAPDISAVFEQQGRGLVFPVALEEDEQALALLHERVDA